MRVEPAGSVDDPEFFNVTAWQGGASVVAPLERVEPGVYRTSTPVPVHDFWKANIRLQQGDALIAVPIYLPEDRAIPAAEVPARASFTRVFRPDLEVLQRERKEGVSGALTAGAYLTVLAIALGLFALLAWALLRVDSAPERGAGHSASSALPSGRSPRSRIEQVWKCTKEGKTPADTSGSFTATPNPRGRRGTGEPRWSSRPLGRTSSLRGGAQALSARARQLTP